jgi:hypothetical protein
MRYAPFFRTLALSVAWGAMSCPQAYAGTSDTPHSHTQPAKQQASVKFEILSPTILQREKPHTLTVRLTSSATGKPLTSADLREVHTQKLHLLVVDQSLSDYQHLHPVEGKTAGEFTVDFTPRRGGTYSIWADIVSHASGQQEYVRAKISSLPPEEKPAFKVFSRIATLDDYTFTLTFETEPKQKTPTTGTLMVRKDGSAFRQLEPVMGAFAHIVGFPEDGESVVHIHPMGKEPTQTTERGGPALKFHVEPEKAGAIKLFAQIRIDGKDLFIPFGIEVAK